MTLRKEEEIEIYGTEYKVKQLTATVGTRLMIRLVKLFSKGAGSLSDILQNEQVKEIVQKFFTNEIIINDLVLEVLPSDIKAKLQLIKGAELPNIEAVIVTFSKYMSEDEAKKYALQVCQTSASSSTPEFSEILSFSGHLLQLLRDIILTVDPDEFDDILFNLINPSILRYRPANQDEFRKWLNDNGDYAFDEHFSGNYNEMLELFVYLILFNYAESFILLKKNRILSYLNIYLKKMNPKKETKS